MSEEKKSEKPVKCPECGAELREPRIGMSRKAKLVRYIGMGLSPVWFMIAWLMVGSGYFSWADNMNEGVKTLGGYFLFFVPLVVGIFVSSTYPRVIPFECFGCGWKHEFELESE